MRNLKLKESNSHKSGRNNIYVNAKCNYQGQHVHIHIYVCKHTTYNKDSEVSDFTAHTSTMKQRTDLFSVPDLEFRKWVKLLSHRRQEVS